MLSVVQKYNLAEIICLNSHVHSCTWEHDEKMWILRISCAGRERVIKSSYVVTASGPLHVPAYPNNIGVSSNGQSAFKGPAFHTAKWDHSVDLKGKRVAIIGTGASAIQIIPIIAQEVGQLFVVQRTPPWVIYKPNFPIPNFVKVLFRLCPFLMWILRLIVYWITELRFPTLINGSLFNKWLRWDLNRFIKSNVKDEFLRKRLTPHFDPGCKRLLFHNTYYKAFSKDNVHLVCDKIRSITETVNSVTT